MMRLLGFGIMIARLLLIPAWGVCETAQEKLERGVFLEETAGRVTEAAAIYSQIIKESQGARPVAAEAMYRLGTCSVRQGNKAKATDTLERMVREYPEQTKFVTKAREQLAALGTSQPHKAPQAFASGGQVEGIWLGKMQLPNGQAVRVVFNIRRESGGSLSAVLDSPDQGAQGIPVDEVKVEGDSIQISVKLIKAEFKGKSAADGTISGDLNQGGMTMPLTLARTTHAPAVTTPVPRKEITVPVAVLDAYVGQYALTPQFSITVTREGTALFAQATNQAKCQIYAETENSFFYKVVEAQLKFVKNAQGKADELILHQNGLDHTAKRIK